MFFPGNKVHGVLNIHNRSKKEIKGISVMLNQIVKLKAQERHTSDIMAHNLVELENPGIPAGGQARADLDFNIPDYVYCSITSSKLVRNFYELAVTLHIPWTVDLTTTVPVTILEKAGIPSGPSENKGG
ncbi:MAG: hypothetical protein GY757_49980 [bacterium]|nr:hypothetical protein [bacterium]